MSSPLLSYPWPYSYLSLSYQPNLSISSFSITHPANCNSYLSFPSVLILHTHRIGSPPHTQLIHLITLPTFAPLRYPSLFHTHCYTPRLHSQSTDHHFSATRNRFPDLDPTPACVKCYFAWPPPSCYPPTLHVHQCPSLYMLPHFLIFHVHGTHSS